MNTSSFKRGLAGHLRTSLFLWLQCRLFLPAKQALAWALRSPNPSLTLAHLQIKMSHPNLQPLNHRPKKMKRALIPPTRKPRTTRAAQAICALLNNNTVTQGQQMACAALVVLGFLVDRKITRLNSSHVAI